jgi:ADP-heptose:LPS heptosyltransferase/2-polyprenyl-3-methyl-5-hydroxy-6-metoxy-1,4-benzoquinol methylase
MSISCILPTHNRRAFLTQSLHYFLRQDHPNRELIILDDGTDCIRDLVPNDPQIRYIRLDRRLSVGAKRNFACEQAAGDIILHWDDDDWYSPWRISYQVSQLLERDLDVCGLDHLYYYQPSSGNAWEYIYPGGSRPWVSGNTLCYRKRLWQQHRFPEIDVAEDARFVWQAPPSRIGRLENSNFIVGIVHPANVSPKVTSGSYWHSRPGGTVLGLMGADAAFYVSTNGAPAPARPKALVSAARGIGDILRVTPLIRVLHRQGYDVDFVIDPDYAETGELFEGLPEIRETRCCSIRQNRPQHLHSDYEIATFTYWSAPLESFLRARRKFVFDRDEWLQKGDSHCITKIARALGWQGDLPPPMAASSGRRFDLPPGTVALHPGCKPDWPWKKWHGFDELARLLPEVAIIGTPSDLDNHATYFRRRFDWPHHARIYIGDLSLRDTVALLSQCAALVSNDSGIMHLGVAAGIPTLGIFGITSPQRENIPAPNMFPITQGLACEPACRRQPFGRRDCEHHLQCLKTLTAEEVQDRLNAILTRSAPSLPAPREEQPAVTKLKVVYHGHVFDASGYGQAARAYVHAFDRAGLELSVADLSGHPPQVQDRLVESLLDKPLLPDFHIFHGIPSIWAQHAFRLPNAIAMTVWETDTMPTQWRNTLNHVLEVWLPCEHNVRAFESRLSKPVFKLPHAIFSPAEGSPPHDLSQLHVRPDDFVFYSIIEWQERKWPLGQITAYLRAFPEDGPHILVLKANPGARDVANATLAEARQLTGSSARVDLRCEAWTEAQIAGLQSRGDCYISLHRGEGWCYPLFDAACRGTPVVATAYSGPLEYLHEEAHQLVPYSITGVRQTYLFYHPRMHWAEPDLNDAARRLQWVYSHREIAREKASAAAAPLREHYAPEAIGELAKMRLLHLLRRHDHPRWQQYRSTRLRPPVAPPEPIPPDWYDADYFENGVKSNWEDGYTWASFSGLFRETAAFLTSMFPEAESFLDAGCAKGFLVKCLRDAGKQAWGFDSSPWVICRAVESALPFLKTAAAESAEWDQTFDFTVALDLFSHLTRDQAEAALTRARSWTKVGLLAVIQLGDANYAAGRDLSHITLRTRAWWHDVFLRSGWRKDALHEVLEGACQRHPLAAKMGWQIFLYSPA